MFQCVPKENEKGFQFLSMPLVKGDQSQKKLLQNPVNSILEEPLILQLFSYDGFFMKQWVETPQWVHT